MIPFDSPTFSRKAILTDISAPIILIVDSRSILLFISSVYTHSQKSLILYYTSEELFQNYYINFRVQIQVHKKIPQENSYTLWLPSVDNVTVIRHARINRPQG